MSRAHTDWSGVAFGVALAAMAAYQQFKLPPVLPDLLERYGYDRVLAGGFMSVYAAVALLVSMPLGRWLEGRRLRLALALACAAAALGNLLALLAPSLGWAVLFGRGLEGLYFALGAILGPAIASASATDRHRPLALGISAAWVPIGQIVAGLAAPLALAYGDWRWLWILGLIGALAIGLWGDVRLRRQASESFSAGAPGRLIAGRRHRLGLTFAALTFLFWSCQYFGFMTWLTQYLVETRGLSDIAAVFVYLLPVAVLMGFNILTGQMLAAGWRLGPLMTGAIASQALAWALIPFAQGSGFGIALLLLYGIGAGISPSCLFVAPGALLGGNAGPRGFAWIMTGRSVGVFAGPILLALLVNAEAGWATAMTTFAAIAAMAALMAACFWRILVSPTAR